MPISLSLLPVVKKISFKADKSSIFKRKMNTMKDNTLTN